MVINKRDEDIIKNYEGTELAIIGMAGRFPGAADIHEFWLNLQNGIESISYFEDEEVLATGVRPEQLSDPHYVKSGGVLENADLFDAEFFGIYPQEAAILDPQQRIFLETAWHALENAGYNPEQFPGYIGLFAGMGMSTYLIFNLIANQEILENVHGYQLTISSDKDFLPTRVSYKLNLRGPSVNVQTACSTSLVAVHLACQSLLNFQCDMALAGGVAIRIPQKQGYLYQEGGIASPDGHCRPFDINAAGTVGGNGVGAVVIKRLDDAITDGDNILAIIKGSAINNDGSLKVGYTAPSVEGQSEVIALAQAVANIDPESISYIEAHGTGTVLGDPIEITALNKVFQAQTSQTGFCAVGSVKANVGHLDAAAGITSMIKTTLALKNRQIPPSINFDAPNPRIDFKNSPFYVNTKLLDWTSNAWPLRAGVSSFGIGGTNAHVVMEEAPQIIGDETSHQQSLVFLSAKSPESLELMTDNLVEFLKNSPEYPLEDIAYTLQVGRKSFDHSRFVVCSQRDELISLLSDRTPGRVYTSSGSESVGGYSPSVVFMFTGQGAQYINMARKLYETEPLFRDLVDQCSEILLEITSEDIREIIYPETTQGVEKNTTKLDAQSERLTRTEFTQPALFVIEYSLANLLIDWGVLPGAMIGHSIGEYVAATISGVFSLEDALKVVAARGRLMQELPSGSMASVQAGEQDVLSLLSENLSDYPNLSLAAINAPSLCVVSGPDQEVASFCELLKDRGIEFRKLYTSHAFHSSMMDPILDEFKQVFSQVELAQPEIPFISNVTGTWITPQMATDPSYWVGHIRKAVRFSDGIQALLNDPAWIFIEVGPGRTLSTLTRAVIMSDENQGERAVISTIRHPNQEIEDDVFLLTSIGQMILAGVQVDWERYYGGERRLRVPLPSYPFERKRFWVEPDHFLTSGHQNRYKIGSKVIQKNPDFREWFYNPSWKRSDYITPGSEIDPSSRWLIFANNETPGNLDQLFIRYLDELVLRYTIVQPGTEYKQLSDNRYSIRPDQPTDYVDLLKALKEEDSLPKYIVHFWTLVDSQVEQLHSHVDSGFYSLLSLTQALVNLSITDPIRILTITPTVHDILGDEEINPEISTLIGLSRVITQEYQNFDCRCVDLEVNSYKGQYQSLIEKISMELNTQSPDRTIAYRGNHRWIPVYDKFHISKDIEESTPPLRLRQNGVYLITGGLGRIGLRFAEYLAKTVKARLILADQFAFIAGNQPSEWEAWIARYGVEDSVSKKANQLLSILDSGSELMIVQVDVASHEEFETALQSAENQFGEINGIIHAAGIVGQNSIKPIAEIEDDDCQLQFQAKVFGTRVLDEVCDGRDMDFIFLQSSLSAILGGLGLGVYSAVNAFMDSYAQLKNRNPGTKWICVDWDGWLFDEEKGSGTTLEELSMSPDEGVQVFEGLMSHNTPEHLVISTADLEDRVERWLKTSLLEAMPNAEDTSNVDVQTKKSTRFPRPNLKNPYVPPQNDIEISIAETWEMVLGIEKVGIHDDFFELGGHSLLATQLVTRLRDTYKVQLPLRRLFESPTVSGIAGLIQELHSDEIQKQAAASDLSGEVTQRKSHEAAIPKIDRNKPIPLSSGQRRLWFLYAMEPESPLYNNFTAIRFKGNLIVDGLQFSLDRMIKRHEILRTVFKEEQGIPTQVILDEMEMPIEFIDLSGSPESLQEEEIVRLALINSRQPFNLMQGPLFRVSIVNINPEENILFLTMHHIISDGWSVGLLIEEVGAYYTAFIEMGSEEAHKFELPELPIQYADYASWQLDWLNSEVLENQLSYWKSQLADHGDGNGSVEILGDRPRPAFQSSRGSSQWFEVSSVIAKKLLNFSHESGVTVFMTLMAALQVLLHRYTGQVDISVGTPIANRTRIETEGLIGFFLNTLVIRSDLSGNPTFDQFLHQVREIALEAYGNQDVPFEMLVEELQPPRDLSRAPFFQVIFDLQEATLPEFKLPGLSISPLKIDSGTAKFDIALSMEMSDHEDEFRLYGYFNYNTDIFDGETITDLIGHWKNLLSSIVTEPTQLVSDLQMMSEYEQEHLLFEWTQQQRELSGVDFIHHQITSIANQRPDRPAVRLVVDQYLQEDEISYQELEERTNQIAHYLVKHGVKKDNLVGFCLERSVDMVVTLLGILKAGAAFLPLDPSYPSSRLNYMLEDAEVRILVTHSRVSEEIRSRFSQLSDLEVINLEEDWGIIKEESSTDPGIKLDGNNLAYIIYTSGSTGLPKGVMITHKELANHCVVIRNHFGIMEDDRVLQFASLNFDAGLEQVFTTLMSGAMLFIRGNEIWPASEFDKIIRESELTIVNVPPAYWHQWAGFTAEKQKSDPAVDNPPLKLVIIGGDVMLPETLRLWHETGYQHVRLLNAYGPTETTITATTFEVGKNSIIGLEKTRRVPIGRPLPNRMAYILDRYHNLLPVGLPGELYFGGMGISRGYLNRPELTADLFGPDQFTHILDPNTPVDTGHRLYRTGDRARYLRDGNIEFLGRVDFQVKVRGFRIELGEIEAVIGLHPVVSEAAVVILEAPDDSTGSENREPGQRIIAYVVTHENQSLSISELIEYLRDQLPAYMVPSQIVFLEKLPLTPGGKLDRESLPEPDRNLMDTDSTFVAPRDPIETQLAVIWSEMLGIEWIDDQSPIGVNDNFFELGGHSLLATQIISRLRELYQVDLPVRKVFESPTIAGLAGIITQSLVETEEQDELEKLLAELEEMTDDDVKSYLEIEDAPGSEGL